MISILLPTRNRIPRLREMMLSALNKAGAPIEIVVYVDDDPATDKFVRMDVNNDFIQEVKGAGPHILTVTTGERGLLSRYWNDCAAKAHGDILMLANDDIVFRTQDWAKVVEAEFAKSPNKIKLVHCDNGQSNAATFATHPFIHRKWVEAVGYFVPPCFPGNWTDTWLFDVSQGAKCRVYIPTVMIEHLHPFWGKAAIDPTYMERVESEGRYRTANLYQDLWPLRELAISKLKEAM